MKFLPLLLTRLLSVNAFVVLASISFSDYLVGLCSLAHRIIRLDFFSLTGQLCLRPCPSLLVSGLARLSLPYLELRDERLILKFVFHVDYSMQHSNIRTKSYIREWKCNRAGINANDHRQDRK
jgi:hypothetical protein